MTDKTAAEATPETSNDPRFADLWGMHGDASTPANQYGSGAAEAWAVGAIGDPSVYVAVLDHGLVLITGQGGAQVVFFPERWETLLLPPLPTAFIDRLENRWDRSGTFYDEYDPLPRDLQYRRSTDSAHGAAHYFNYVTSDRRRLIIVYALGPEDRVVRIVDLPEAWDQGTN